MADKHGQFTRELKLVDTDQQSNGRAYFKLDAPFVYEIDSEGMGLEVVVPRGYLTDFASIPRFFWRAFPPTGPYRRAAVIHDWLYSSRACSRAIADAVFLDAMNSLGVPWWPRIPVYLAVRCFGWLFFYRKGS